MSIVFNKIRFRNFGPFGNIFTELDLCKAGLTQISGQNMDKGGSSGAGKSTIINAICYCLYDKIPATVSKEKLINNINNNTKSTEMEVILEFTKDGVDNYVIRRTRGASVSISITKNGKDDTDAGIYSANDRIVGIIGMSFDLFIRVVAFNGNATPFLDLPVSNQRNESEELFKVTILSQKATALKEEIKIIEKDIAIENALIAQQRATIERHAKQIKDAEDRVTRWENDRSLEIKSIDRQLTRIDNVDFDNEELLHVELKRLLQLHGDVVAKLTPLRKDEVTLTQELTKLNKEHGHLADSKCPYCLQKFAAAKERIVGLKTDIEASEVALSELSATIALLTIEEQGLKAEIKQIESIIQHNDLTELLKIKNGADALRVAREKLLMSTNPHTEALASLINDPTANVDSTKLNRMMDQHEHMKFLLKLLTDKNSFIRKRIISKTMPLLNRRIGYYAAELGLPHTVTFQPDMSCEITELKRELDHGNLSGGEQLRLNLALTFAFRDVMTQLHQAINVLFADEIDGGNLGGHEVDHLIRVLKHKAWNEHINIFTISHRPEFEGRCDNNIIIRKERGFSTLIDES